MVSTDKIHRDQFAGCYYPRFIAGSSTLSNHAFGLALDINAVENQRGTVGLIDRGVVAIFQKWGFTWGGDWGYTDPMHFELNSIRHPRPESAAQLAVRGSGRRWSRRAGGSGSAPPARRPIAATGRTGGRSISRPSAGSPHHGRTGASPRSRAPRGSAYGRPRPSTPPW